MLEATMNNEADKPAMRCTECDRVMEHYITFTGSTNEESNVCWECTDREEKGYNTKRDWKRAPRQKQIEEVTGDAGAKQ